MSEEDEEQFWIEQEKLFHLSEIMKRLESEDDDK